VYHHRVGVRRFDPLDQRFEHWPTWTDHALRWIHNALDGVLDICRRERHTVVPLHALMQVERDRLATVTDVPGIRQFRDNIEGHWIVGACTDETVIGRRCRSVDSAERGLVHVK
jgi:hypothetical protein